MRVLTDYEFYLLEYNRFGVDKFKNDTAFYKYSRKASLIVNNATMHRLESAGEIPADVQHCVCEIAELLFEADERDKARGGVSSETVGGWTRSYESNGETDANTNRKIHQVVCSWLSGTGLLFRGV